MKIASSAFEEGAPIPQKYTADGENTSPPLNWAIPPEGTKSIALICHDPDAPVGDWVHWVLFNLPGGTVELPEGMETKEILDNGAKQGLNDFKKIGYGGPAPPKGPAHRYYFKVYALDTELDLEVGASRKDVESAMSGHILAQGQLMGKYGR